MKIVEYFSSDNKTKLLEELSKCEWAAGKFLYDMLLNNKLQENVGMNALVFMLMDEDKLVSFCTFAPKDEIQPTNLTPWIGFVYTFEEYRGHHYAGMLIDYCECIATVMGKENVYISTDHIGLYEKYGYEFYAIMKGIGGDDCRVYTKKLQIDGEEKNRRLELGDKYKSLIVSKAKKNIDI